MKKDVLYNPSFEMYKTPIGSLEIFEVATLNLYINKNFNIHDLKLVLYDDVEVIGKYDLYYQYTNEDYNIFKVEISIEKPYLYWYYFEFNDCYGKHYIGASKSLDAILVDYNVSGFQINVYEPFKSNLSWFKGKILYQIMVDRFCKGGNNPLKKDGIYHEKWDEIPNYKPINGKILNNDFFGGDFEGIINKIDYLKSLNVGAIYLNPIFLSPSNHKYNTSDYLTIDPTFGTIDDFKMLVKVLKENGIELILDGVFNHTGDDSIYFNKYGNFDELGAYQSKKSKYADWYKFIKYPDKYKSWWGIDTLPAVNQESSFKDFIINKVIKKWNSFGIKGYRLDVVDEINDKFLKEICKAIKNDSNDFDKIIIGEVWEDASNKISYNTRRTYFNGCELDSVMNYPVKNAIIDYLKNGNGYHLVYVLRNLINNYPKHVLDSLMNILSTHDTVRIITEFSRVNYNTLTLDERASFKLSKNEYYVARSKLKMACMILYTIPGVPTIYYGDEAGVEGFKDPFCRKTMPWGNLDKDIYSFYKQIGEIRNYKVFIDGIYQELFYKDGVFAYSRKKDNEEIITIINNSNYDFQFNIDSGIDLLDNTEINNYCIIYAQTGKIIKKKGEENEK